MASMKTGFLIGVAVAGVAAAALAGGGVRWVPNAGLGGHGLPITRVSTASIFSPPPSAPLSFADIFQRVSPAVVSIDVTSHIDPRELRAIPGFPFSMPPNDDQDDQDDDGSGGGGGPGGPGGPGGGKIPMPKGPKAQSSGSGFFISPDGYLVTNNHVVQSAEEIKVTLTDGRVLPAKVIGRDEDTDIAVLKVQGSGFPFVDFENSAKPRVGDWVLAVGNPYGLTGTATAGIVSAYGRNIGDNFVDFIQIDAPINRGNSGGPTFDIYGRVIGVNSAIVSPSGGSVGIGFAIPADVADNISKQLIAGGKITRGYLGATIQDVTPEIAESMGLGKTKGALVADLVPEGPAQRSGVMSGDVVVQLNGHPVTSATDLTRFVAGQHPGDVLHLQVLRGGKPKSIDVTSGTRPPPSQLAANDEGRGAEPGSPRPQAGRAEHPTALGLTLAPLDADVRSHLGLSADFHGVVVLGVKSESDADDKGLRPGDIIVRAGESNVASPAEVVAAVAQARHEGRTSILLGIHREGVTRFAPIKLGP
jgi:serine protease Do